MMFSTEQILRKGQISNLLKSENPKWSILKEILIFLKSKLSSTAKSYTKMQTMLFWSIVYWFGNALLMANQRNYIWLFYVKYISCRYNWKGSTYKSVTHLTLIERKLNLRWINDCEQLRQSNVNSRPGVQDCRGAHRGDSIWMKESEQASRPDE